MLKFPCYLEVFEITKVLRTARAAREFVLTDERTCKALFYCICVANLLLVGFV